MSVLVLIGGAVVAFVLVVGVYNILNNAFIERKNFHNNEESE